MKPPPTREETHPTAPTVAATESGHSTRPMRTPDTLQQTVPVSVRERDLRSTREDPSVGVLATRSELIVGHEERYREGELLGRGGMGEVKLFRDRRIGREVAVKTLRLQADEGSAAWQRFVREARVQGQLEHPAIVPVYDMGVAPDGNLFFTMRRVQGQSLAELIDLLSKRDSDTVARWSQRKLLGAFVQVCLAVDYAHKRGVIHRDLKPGNVMLGEFGEVQVLDWGLARVGNEQDVVSASGKAVSDSSPTPLTMDGSVMGTPAYMPIEQFRGDISKMGPHTDVFALGMILYELLTLRSYHGRGTIFDISNRVFQGLDVRPSSIDPELPKEFDAICLKATARNPEDRYPSARALADALEEHLDSENDRSKRRELAVEHARRAQQLTSAVVQSSQEDDVEMRRNAMREALQSIALDPHQREAQHALVSLLTHLPERLPKPVRDELEQSRQRRQVARIRLSVWAWVIWFSNIPALLLLGVRSLWVWIVGSLMILVGGAQAFVYSRRTSVDGWPMMAYAATLAVFIGIFSSWLGPFTLVPVATSALMMGGISDMRMRDWWVSVGLSAMVVIVPYVLELLGWIPPSTRFTSEGMLMLPRAFELKKTSTEVALLWSNVTFLLMPAYVLYRVRQTLFSAERKVSLHAWQLRMLTEANDHAS